MLCFVLQSSVELLRGEEGRKEGRNE